MRSEVVKLVSISKRGLVIFSDNVEASCAIAGEGGAAMGTAYAVEGQYGKECTIGHSNEPMRSQLVQ